jgi:hypothetical protein
MERIAVWVRDATEWALVHRCGCCRVVRVNRIAGDDNEYSLLALAARPMKQPPFPVTRLQHTLKAAPVERKLRLDDR